MRSDRIRFWCQSCIRPIAEAGELIKRVNPQTLFHVDAVQGFGKFRIYPARTHVDMMSVSAHKIHGPKGTGFLYIRKGAKVSPIIYGGGQQKGMRSGTENVAGAAGLARAAELMYLTNRRRPRRLRRLAWRETYWIPPFVSVFPSLQLRRKSSILYRHYANWFRRSDGIPEDKGVKKIIGGILCLRLF